MFPLQNEVSLVQLGRLVQLNSSFNVSILVTAPASAATSKRQPCCLYLPGKHIYRGKKNTSFTYVCSNNTILFTQQSATTQECILRLGEAYFFFALTLQADPPMRVANGVGTWTSHCLSVCSVFFTLSTYFPPLSLPARCTFKTNRIESGPPFPMSVPIEW